MSDAPSILLNGSFDLLHAGHFNVLRQAKERFPKGRLVAGIHPACAFKGAAVYSVEEKEKLLRACHFVDDVVINLPYGEITPTLLDELRCDFACHGDDPVILASGVGMYDAAKRANRFVELSRSEGVSTTILIHRILYPELPPQPSSVDSTMLDAFRRFSVEKPSQVVFIAGSFDLLHFTHVDILEAARKFGNFLLVGISDGRRQGPVAVQTVNKT